MTGQVSNSSLDLSVLLGKSIMPFEDFYKVKVGDVIKLDQATQKDLTLLIGKVPKYKGRPMMNGNKYVFSITDSIHQGNQ